MSLYASLKEEIMHLMHSKSGLKLGCVIQAFLDMLNNVDYNYCDYDFIALVIIMFIEFKI